MRPPSSPSSAPDQADGLRRLFAHRRLVIIPLVSNPHVAHGGVLIERLCTAFALQGRHTLVIDAAERANDPGEAALFDLQGCVEVLSDSVSYLPAQSLPLRHVDAQGSTAGFLTLAAEAAPHADVLLVHANASELCRLFSRQAEPPRPLLLADDRPASVTHAYANMKLLVQRAGMAVHDLLLGAAPQSPRAERIAMQLATCADDFLGAVLRDWIHIDPECDATDAPPPSLQRWVLDRLGERPGARFGAGAAMFTKLHDSAAQPAPLAARSHADRASQALQVSLRSAHLHSMPQSESHATQTS
jgi:flagellar biosynthesis protein FlhG